MEAGREDGSSGGPWPMMTGGCPQQGHIWTPQGSPTTADNLPSLRGPQARVSASRDITGWNGSRAHAEGPAEPGGASQTRLLREAFPVNPTPSQCSGSGVFQPVLKRVSSHSELAEMFLNSALAATRVHGFSL